MSAIEKPPIKVNGSWEDVVDAARFTVNKAPLGHDPSEKFKRDALIAEHSPIRLRHFIWRWEDIPHWVGVHFVRHVWECFVGTQRTDRTGIDRTKLPQDEPSRFMGEANPQHLIDTSRKRLCYLASPETREKWEGLKLALRDIDPCVSEVMVPNCVYRCGCPEGDHECGFFRKLCSEDSGFCSPNIRARYALYNTAFYKRFERTEVEG